MWREAIKENLVFVWLGDLSKPRSGSGPRLGLTVGKLAKVLGKVSKGIELGIAQSQIL